MIRVVLTRSTARYNDLPQINDGQALIRPTVTDKSHSIKNNTHRFNTRFNVGMNKCVKERKVAVRTRFHRDQAKPVQGTISD